jgi:RNA polymerase sigma-70 factor, ECF subfamily
MRSNGNRARFEREMLPHLDAAYNLARRLLRSGADAEDVAQEALLRAFKYLEGFHGDNAKAWLLSIVRNACYDWIRRRPRTESMSESEDGLLDPAHERALAEAGHGFPAPDARLIESADRQRVQTALAALPRAYREILVLREIEGLSYREIGVIAAIPIGTVMSRLSRARSLMLEQLSAEPRDTPRSAS